MGSGTFWEDENFGPFSPRLRPPADFLYSFHSRTAVLTRDIDGPQSAGDNPWGGGREEETEKERGDERREERGINVGAKLRRGRKKEGARERGEEGRRRGRDEMRGEIKEREKSSHPKKGVLLVLARATTVGM